MRTSVPGVFAAGDCASYDWPAAAAPHWFPMRLWGQARAAGVYAAHCMAGAQAQVRECVCVGGGGDAASHPATHLPHPFTHTHAHRLPPTTPTPPTLPPRQTGAGMAFELFSHATRFLGRKVVLLGRYNGQGLEGEPPGDLISYSRVTEASEGRGGGGDEGRGAVVGAPALSAHPLPPPPPPHTPSNARMSPAPLCACCCCGGGCRGRC